METAAGDDLRNYPETRLTSVSTGPLITVWDAPDRPPTGPDLIYCWRGYAETPTTRSLLRYIDSHAERLRGKYVSWVHELGEHHVDGKRLIEHFALDDCFSYWWMTLFVEQSPWKSRSIVDAIRVFALEEILLEQQPRLVRLITADTRLRDVLRGLCRNIGVPFEWRRGSAKRQALSLRRIYNVLPESAKAIFKLLHYLAVHWRFTRVEEHAWLRENAVFFCSYFENVDRVAAEQRQFYSHFWGALHSLLQSAHIGSNWIHIFQPSSAIASPGIALDLIGRFNRTHAVKESHTFIHTYLSPAILARVVKRWRELGQAQRRVRGVKAAFSPGGSHFSLWSLMSADWTNSMRGPKAVENLLWVELFDKALKSVPQQVKGFYLCENQAWERAFISAWRRNGHGTLVGVAHSTVRFWDLRYFTDARTVQSTAPHGIPRPDAIALNGKAAVETYLTIERQVGEVLECEANRYRHLAAMSERRGSEVRNGVVKTLILGDYTERGTTTLLKMAEAAVSSVLTPMEYAVKPHPNCMVRSADYPDLQFDVISGPLANVLAEFDIVLAGNLTSAAVEAYCYRLPVIVLLDECELNFSPLRDCAGVEFVSSSGELATALDNAATGGSECAAHESFFFLDPNMPRWSRLLVN